MIYGHHRVLAQHAHGNEALRVWVEDTRTGERSFHVLNLTDYKTN